MTWTRVAVTHDILLHEHAVVSEALDATAQRVGDQQPIVIREDPARRAPLARAVALRRHASQNPTIDMEALHGALPRSFAHRDVDPFAVDRDRMRLIEHAGAVFGAVAARGHRQAEIAKVLAKRVKATDTVIVRVGNKDPEVPIDGNSASIGVAGWASRVTPRRNPLVGFQVVQKHMATPSGPCDT